MDKNKILEYINNTPENTNPAIVSSMLDGYNSAEKWAGETTGLSEGSGDVTISYKGTVLGNLSNSGTAVLETEDTICEDDIEVEYTKPSGTTIGNTVNLSTGIVDEAVTMNGNFFNTTGVYSIALYATHDNPGTALALCESGPGGYRVNLYHESEEDVYSITVNGTPISYDRGRYLFRSSSANPINGQTYNVVINHK